jgi:hypothetical protein
LEKPDSNRIFGHGRAFLGTSHYPQPNTIKLMMIETFKIENEDEADAYLRDLLAKPEYRSMSEVYMRAKKLIPDAHLRNYFINRAKAIVET